MNKKLLYLILLVFLFLVSSPALAAENPLEKLNRGVVNIVTSPLEIAKQVNEGLEKSSEKQENVGKGVFTGFFKGIFYSVGRLGSGVWDIVTFPLKFPKDYGSLMNPEFVLDEEKKPEAPKDKKAKK